MNNNKLLICPMKFIGLAKTVKIVGASNAAEVYRIAGGCEGKNCAWYCTYPSGEGECAIHSLPSFFDGLQDIGKEIGIK